MEEMNGAAGKQFLEQPYIQYGKFTFKNETSKLQKLDPATVDLDHFVKHDFSHKSQVAHWKPSFSDLALCQSPLAGVKHEMDAKTDAVINGFFDGTVSDEELSNTFQEMVG